jgi:hypothetical protein
MEFTEKAEKAEEAEEEETAEDARELEGETYCHQVCMLLTTVERHCDGHVPNLFGFFWPGVSITVL